MRQHGRTAAFVRFGGKAAKTNESGGTVLLRLKFRLRRNFKRKRSHFLAAAGEKAIAARKTALSAICAQQK
jgi:hypothetical protein